MTITFDQLLETIVFDPVLPGRIRKPEAGFENVQGNSHAIGSLIFEWKINNLTNAQIIEILNLNVADSELTTVKTSIDALNKADTLALEDAMILAENAISASGITYNKALLRARFGL